MFHSRTPRLARQPRPGLFQRILAALALHRQRQHLRDLDAHMLRDIGLTAAQARVEADQPFWRMPHHWLIAAHIPATISPHTQQCATCSA